MEFLASMGVFFCCIDNHVIPTGITICTQCRPKPMYFFFFLLVLFRYFLQKGERKVYKMNLSLLLNHLEKRVGKIEKKKRSKSHAFFFFCYHIPP